MSSMRFALALALATIWTSAAALPTPAIAQQPTGQPGQIALTSNENLVDRVVAVVGDSVVLESQVMERMLQLEAEGLDIPDDPAARSQLRREMVDELVDEQLVVQAALKDTTIVVDPQRVQEAVSQELDQRARSFGGQEAMRQALQAQGLTLSGYRDMLRDNVRRQLLQNQYLAMRQRDVAAVSVSEREMRDFFEENRDRIGQRPPTLTFERVSLRPQATEDATAAARAEAEALLDSLRQGADFEELARAHSDDTGSARQGGSLGWFRRGQMVPVFENAVFSLRQGQISSVVESRFGFHIIRVDRIRGAERRARHILVSPEVRPEDVESMRARATEIAERLRAGEPIDSLQALYSADEQVDPITVPREQLTSLPAGYPAALRNARPEDVVGPIEWGGQGQTNVDVLLVTDVREGGAYAYEDVVGQIRQRLQQEKLLDQIFAELRQNTHVEIRI